MQTYDQLKAVGLRYFAEHGYEGTSLSQIAAAVGIKKPSIYNHFANKEALFLTLVEDVENDMLARVDASLARHAHRRIEERLYGLVQDICSFIFQEHRGMLYKRFLLFPPSHLRAALAEVNRNSEDRINAGLNTLFEAGYRSGELRAMRATDFSAAFYCLIDGLFTESFVYPREAFDKRLEGAWSVFWAGVRNG